MSCCYELLCDRTPGLSDEDRDLLEDAAVEIAGELRECDLVDTEAVNVATIPVPVVEIEYPDRQVTLRLELERYDEEEAGA
jgi:hypothetical protein